MRTVILLICFCLLPVVNALAQKKDSVTYLPVITENGDTLPHQDLAPVTVFPKKSFKSRRYERQYWILVRRVKKVLPYARKAAELVREYDVKYKHTDDRKLRRKYMKEAEKRLMDEYGPQLKKLSISEGRILIKLIDRETKHTSYDLIKDLKGGFTAFFWQGVARLFGNDLKDDYDPATEDRQIEEIIMYIDAGVL